MKKNKLLENALCDIAKGIKEEMTRRINRSTLVELFEKEMSLLMNDPDNDHSDLEELKNNFLYYFKDNK